MFSSRLQTLVPRTSVRGISSIPTTFKSLVYSTHDRDDCASVLSVKNYKPVQNLDNSIVLRTLAFPINPSDINQLQGVYPSKPEKTMEYQTSEPAAIAGNEGVFEVIHTPGDKTNLKKGDWVIPLMANQGTWTNYRVFSDESQLIKVNGLDLITAATIGVNGVTAYQMVNNFIDWHPDENNWLVQNAGNSTVSKMVSQIAKLKGIKTLSVVRDRPTQEEFDKLASSLESEFGATKVISETQNASKDFSKNELKMILGPDPKIKLALNSVGGPSSSAIARKLDKDGLMLTYGGLSKKPVTIPTSLLIFKNITFQGYWVTALTNKNPQTKVDDIHELVKLYQEGKFTSPKEDIELLEWDTTSFQDSDVLNMIKGGINSKNSRKKLVVLNWEKQ